MCASVLESCTSYTLRPYVGVRLSRYLTTTPYINTHAGSQPRLRLRATGRGEKTQQRTGLATQGWERQTTCDQIRKARELDDNARSVLRKEAALT